MTTAEIFLSIFTLLFGSVWVGDVLKKRIESKNSVDLKKIEKDHVNVDNLKSKVAKQYETIRDQNEHIDFLTRQISAMQLKLDIIVPMLKRVLRDDPDNLEILKHLEHFDTGTNTDSAHGK